MVSDDDYLRQLVADVHLNPAKAGLARMTLTGTGGVDIVM